MKAFQEKTVEVKGAELFCRTLGYGSPVIVIHGGPGMSQEYLLPGMAKLSEKHLLVFYDQRASGRSSGDISDETMCMEVFVDDLASIQSAFALERVALLGHSWGGRLAAEYAIKHPDAVDKLILVSASGCCLKDFTLFLESWSRKMIPYLAEVEEIEKSEEFVQGQSTAVESYFRTIFKAYCYKPETSLQLNLVGLSARSLKVMSQMEKNVLSSPFDLRQALQMLRIPTLIIHGESDIVPLSTAKNWHENIPNSKYAILKNCGHFPYIEQPEDFFDSLEEFLQAKTLR